MDRYVQEVYQVFSDYISQNVRLYSANGNFDIENFVEINCTVGKPLFSSVSLSHLH